MSNTDNNAQQPVKVCNHKPGDLWDEGGCCKSQKKVSQAQGSQIVNKETRELMHQDKEGRLFSLRYPPR